ncbi:MAG: hypothetical protein OSB00_05200 [Sphingomonas bacterium]|nr:hypothetical protein [Sphingomonas bacterium]
MKIDFALLLRDAWAVFRRDRDLLLRIAGVFFFLPSFVLVLFVPPTPAPDPSIADRQAQAEAWMTALEGWLGDYGLGCAIAYLVGYMGLAILYTLYLDRARPTVGGALHRAVRNFPRFFLAMLVVSLPTGAAMYLLLLPGLWLMSRFFLTGPIVIADDRTSALRAIGQSWRATRRAQWSLLGVVALVYLSGMLMGQPFLLLGEWLARQGAANPVVGAITGAAAAGVAMAAQLASALLAISAYRRLVAR